MSLSFFDPKQATQLAKFQGSFAGAQAGNVTVTGVATAPTSIYNQAGYYAVQDPNTGYVSLKKMGDDSLYTNYWYDQGTNTEFDFTEGGKGITCFDKPSTGSSNDGSIQDYLYGTGYTTDGAKALQQVSPYVEEYEVEDENEIYQGTTATPSAAAQTEEATEEQIMLTADDLEDLAKAGVYDNLAEALEATLSEGYGVSDEEQAELGLYSDKDEDKIQLVMEKYGLTRDEAISKLGDKITSPETSSQLAELKELYQEVKDQQGFIGKAWNSFKNLFNVGVSSEDVDTALEQFENGEITYDEASALIEEYAQRQGKATNGIKNAGAALATTVLGFATGGVGFVAGAATGATTKALLGIADRASNNVDDDEITLKDCATDIATGAVTGTATAGVGKVAKGCGKFFKAVAGIFKKIF